MFSNDLNTKNYAQVLHDPEGLLLWEWFELIAAFIERGQNFTAARCTKRRMNFIDIKR